MFDILGLVFPHNCVSKNTIAEGMADRTDWDDGLPEELFNVWRTWREELPLVTKFLLPEFTLTETRM